jgi:hypothetical protein
VDVCIYLLTEYDANNLRKLLINVDSR